VLLADLVATTEAVRATRARSAKVAALADLLRRLAPEERLPATALLAGEPRQGKVGIGWATVAEAGEEVDPAPEPTLTVADLDGTLDAVAALSGPGSGGARVAAIRALLVRATEAEAELLRRLLLGDLRQGALEGIMADAVAKAADVPAALVRRAAMLAGDLPAVAEQALAGGAEALAGVGLRVLTPVQPMLAATSATVAEAVAGCGRSSVEWKLDGARVQAHRAGDEVRLFTRNLNDVTARLPGVADVVRSLPVGSVVLDGEVLYGEERPAAFQDTMRRFSNQSGGGSGLGVWFFDVLHVDGTDLLDEPLEARVEVLERVAGPWRIPSTFTDDPEEAAGVLDDALANGHEGVVVKGASSLYEAGRRGSAWRKVKPVRTLDLVVLAAEWGHGRRQGWLSNLHLGARDPAGGFVMVGKTFKGLTDELLAWQTEQLLAREEGRSGIVVEVRPELVVEIALDGVQASPRYPGGVALRFARVRRYRDDKGPAEADLIADVQAMLPGRS
jgi:DNA ligase-1